MTPTTTPEHCPSCESTEIDTETDLATGLCTDCGLVLDGQTSVPSSPSPSESPDGERGDSVDGRDDNGTPDVDWREAVEVKDVSDQRLVDLLTRVDVVAEDLALAEAVRVRTAELVVEAWESRFMHGRSEDATIAACVSIACREAKRPRPAPAIGEAIGVKASKLKSAFRKLVAELELQPTPVGPAEYVPYVGAELALDSESMAVAAEGLREADGIPGNPAGIAGAALYLSTRDCASAVTLSLVGQAAGVTKETVWQRVADLRSMDALEKFEKESQKGAK